MRNKNLIGFLFALVLIGCGREKLATPKPPAYLRIDMPDHKYLKVEDNCPYSFDLNEVYGIKPIIQGEEKSCHKDLLLNKLNGVIHFSYIVMDTSLSVYVNYANDKVDEHKVKASAIETYKFIKPESKVYGALFELKGDVASPFQFYLTDSTDRFVSGVVYFNTAPNYDSLKPSLDYLKVDLQKLMSSFEWK